MFDNKNFDQLLEENEKQIKELERQCEALDRQTKKVFADLKLTPDQVTHYFNDPANFTPEDWNQLQEERKKMDETLKEKLAEVRDTKAAKQNLANLNLPSYAIHCR